METTRRNFVKNAALMAAGAGIGLSLAGGSKRVMTEVKLILFSKDPIAIKAAIHSNERLDTFSIDMAHLKARIPLSDIRGALKGWQTRFDAVLEAPKETKRLPARAYIDGDRFCIEEDKPNAAPCWIRLADVREAAGLTA